MSLLTKTASEIAMRSRSESMLPVIEKELLHYEILASLHKAGVFSSVVFQGGTCLRLCYGSKRYSEDLDFAGGPEFSWTDFLSIGEIIETHIADAYDVSVRVKEPRDAGGLTSRWQIIVDTAPERPDLPSQRIKLEVGRIPAYTAQPRNLILNYPEVSPGYADIIVRAESEDEIIADKIVSFYDSRYTRFRDLWDLNWMQVTGSPDYGRVAELVALKCADYAISRDPADVPAESANRMRKALEDPSFLTQMSRFVTSDAAASTIARPEYLTAMGDNLTRLGSEVGRHMGQGRSVVKPAGAACRATAHTPADDLSLGKGVESDKRPTPPAARGRGA